MIISPCQQSRLLLRPYGQQIFSATRTPASLLTSTVIISRPAANDNTINFVLRQSQKIKINSINFILASLYFSLSHFRVWSFNVFISLACFYYHIVPWKFALFDGHFYDAFDSRLSLISSSHWWEFILLADTLDYYRASILATAGARRPLFVSLPQSHT